MDPVNAGLVGLQLIGGISGMLGASSARRRALEARQRAIAELMRQMAEEERLVQERNAYGLLSNAGYLRDALEAQGGALGSAAAQAGVYNSSAVAGALSRQARENAQILADLTAKSQSELAQLRAKNRQNIAQQKLGFAATDYDIARQEEANTLQGIIAGLSALAKLNAPRQPQQTTSTPTTRTTPIAPAVPTGNPKADNGILSEWLRQRLNITTTQQAGPAMNGNFNWTLKPLAPIIPPYQPILAPITRKR